MPSSQLHNESIPIDSLYMHASNTTKVLPQSNSVLMHYSTDLLLVCFFNADTTTSLNNYKHEQ